MKAFKAFIKPFEAQQRRENNNLSYFLFLYIFLQHTGQGGLTLYHI